MQITVKAIEVNARRNGVAILNGVEVNIDHINMQGSEKQIAWADKIARQDIRVMIEARVRKASTNGLYDAQELDALIAKLNAELVDVAARIDGKHASLWIDNRGGGQMTVRKVFLG